MCRPCEGPDEVQARVCAGNGQRPFASRSTAPDAPAHTAQVPDSRLCTSIESRTRCNCALACTLRTMRLKSCVGPLINLQSTDCAPSKAKTGLSRVRRCVCSSGPCPRANSTPSPSNTANQRCTPSNRENGPSVSTCATEIRQCQSATPGGQLSNSRVVPPPFFQGIGVVSARAMCGQLTAENFLASCSACPDRPSVPGWPHARR